MLAIHMLSFRFLYAHVSAYIYIYISVHACIITKTKGHSFHIQHITVA